MTSSREAVRDKLVQAQAGLKRLAQGEPGSAALEWQTGYVKALEEVLDLESLSRDTMRDKLVDARAVSEKSGAQVETRPSTMEWQQGYAKAVEDVLELEGISLRRYPRRQTIIPTEIARMIPKERAHGHIMDLSAGGCRIVTEINLSVGDVIELSFTLPDRSRRLTLEGLVHRTRRGDGEYTAGVEFVGFPEGVDEEFGAFFGL